MLQTVASIQKIKCWSYISRGRLSEVWLDEGGGEWMINEYRMELYIFYSTVGHFS